MGKKYRVEYDRANCIGAAACAAVNPKYWEMQEDGKADIVGGKRLDENKKQETIIDEEDLKAMMEAAESCPVNVIHVYDLETGERLI